MSGRERMAEPADINVDELRRRARRRLVGAVVLALGVAVVVPMLLETEQRPLGEDVSVRIPPLDDSKFVNKLSENRNRDAAKAIEKGASGKDATAPRPTESPSPAAERISKYDMRVPDSPAGGAAPTDVTRAGTASAPSNPIIPPSSPANPPAPRAPAPSSSTPPEASSSTAVVPGASSPATPASSAASAAKADAAKTDATRTDTTPVVIEDRSKPAAAEKSSRSDTRVAATAPSSAAAPGAVGGPSDTRSTAHDGFAVQLAAFADDKGANALAGRLKRSGYAAYTEPLKTSKGTLWRVRVGPYPSREAALAARERLKSEGQSGIVAAVK